MGKKRYPVPKIIIDHQARKPDRSAKEKFCDGSGFQGDIRFKYFSDALKIGDFDTCNKIREDNKDDLELLSKCTMLERKWVLQMPVYIREVQIALREAMGWRELARAYKKQSDAIKGKKILKQVVIGIARGNAILQQVEAAKKNQPELNIPGGFPKPTLTNPGS